VPEGNPFGKDTKRYISGGLNSHKKSAWNCLSFKPSGLALTLSPSYILFSLLENSLPQFPPNVKKFLLAFYAFVLLTEAGFASFATILFCSPILLLYCVHNNLLLWLILSDDFVGNICGLFLAYPFFSLTNPPEVWDAFRSVRQESPLYLTVCRTPNSGRLKRFL